MQFKIYINIFSTAESLTMTGLPFSSMVSWYAQSGTSNTSATRVLERVSQIVDRSVKRSKTLRLDSSITGNDFRLHRM